MFVHEKKPGIQFEHFEEFMSFMIVERNASKLTISSYTSDFRVLEEYLSSKNMSSEPPNFVLNGPNRSPVSSSIKALSFIKFWMDTDISLYS